MQGKENSMLEVRVASSYLTYNNAKIKKREVWGTDVYTDDSDVVAMLIHSGFYIPPLNANSTEQDLLHPTSQQHNFVPEPIKHICPGFDLAVTLRVLPKLVKYQGSIRHRIKSRTWNTGHDGVSFKIESIRKLCPGEALNRGRGQSKLRMKEYNQERLRVLANIHDETTESLQNERAMRTATFEFTNQGDPCFKYSPELVMDRHDGLSRKWTSWRLKKEVMILENDEERYEISLQHHAGTDARRFDQYRFAVISPRTSLSSWSKTAYPLDPADLTEVLYEDLDWQDFEWVERGVVVQPSQRAKQNSSSSSMEGVEPTTEGQSKTFLPTTEVMDIDGGESKGNGQEDGSRKLKSGPSNPSDTLDTQQDGVFCVVSRLFWRPMSELRPAKSVKVGQSKSTEIKPANGLEKINATEMHHPQVEVKETAPTLTKSSGNSYEQIGVPSSSSASPKTSSAQDDNNSKAQTSFGTLRTKDPSQDHVVTTVSISDQPSSASIGAASAVPATTARSVQEAVRPQEPSGQHEPQHLQAKPPHSDSVAAEREEGELEESE
ncbi:hypothetical protein BX616_005897 [Lobosporangium transversale]|uniref:Histone deacetylation protein Rxt3-domain-containing protein n=1 Tax=Lobosporangium transversale TaxID=64571 RepID=A0A1Y2GXB9_9FUNG|nr:histone deacetylation protein Rxt3-domain-containing protein [Lobosporangium transversale]KAF9897267.1 hypothetical protein BX616_005897 [Lobosporangium transversale]ORZ26464.1 histone deacetylation protein Rxt3-domain-containing protein [Lobosporangium transversale]|eukprot:XP_021884229.1 histone deacetylation protein Rxt3-domain-containing protein [Lobosporangium transversale]